MLCNECWLEIEVKGEAVATACGHLYCVKCAQTIMEQHGTCPMCENILSKSTVKLATMDMDPGILKLQMLGQSPEVAMAAALAATNFYIAQQDLYHQYREAAVRKKAQKVQDTCKVKLDEVHNGYQQAKRKYQDTMQKKAALEQELNDLQRKYSAKVMQNRKLQEMFKRVHQENEQLRNSNSHSGSHNLANSKSVSGESNVVQTQTSPESLEDDDNGSGLSTDMVGGTGSNGSNGGGKHDSEGPAEPTIIPIYRSSPVFLRSSVHGL
eukprot:TRINITY_DN40198_c0_g1_i3.p1 TRINITY_DN40198_c0_g1~~TRINITY_DN40198_c0_g1_i3.p1  ORF type:complete len:267 (-),score=37.23 TRINITY_DN40198_c0_g1_i3:55-855(-)